MKPRTIRSGRLQPLVSVVSTNCKQSSTLCPLPPRLQCQAGERRLWRHLRVLSETVGDPAAGTEERSFST